MSEENVSNESNEALDPTEALEQVSDALVLLIQSVVDQRLAEYSMGEDEDEDEGFDSDFEEEGEEEGEDVEEDADLYTEKELMAFTKAELTSIVEEDWEYDASELKTKVALKNFILEVQEEGFEEEEEEVEEPDPEPEPEPEPEPVARQKRSPTASKSKKETSSSAAKAKSGKKKGVGRYLKK